MGGLWLILLFVILLIPITMIGFGAYFKNHAPKDINSVFGYRTKLSMKNKDTWELAHHYFGKEWLYLGLLLLPISVACMALLFGKSDDFIGDCSMGILFLQMIIMLFPIITTQRKLKEVFDESGRRK